MKAGAEAPEFLLVSRRQLFENLDTAGRKFHIDMTAIVSTSFARN
jgi:hypothetical protein